MYKNFKCLNSNLIIIENHIALQAKKILKTSYQEYGRSNKRYVLQYPG